jgi:hypothetical protein
VGRGWLWGALVLIRVSQRKFAIHQASRVIGKEVKIHRHLRSPPLIRMERNMSQFGTHSRPTVLRLFVAMAVCIALAACANPGSSQGRAHLDQVSCNILHSGNQAYVKADYETAAKIYMQIQQVDLLGRGACTASIYASIGSTWLYRGHRETQVSPQKAILNYRRAAFWNRAFASAATCRLGNCSESENFWNGGGKEPWLVAD